MNHKIPDYLTKFSTNIMLLVFVLVFSILFIYVYTPFDVSTWNQVHTPLENFIYASIVISGSFSIMVLSRLILWAVCKRDKLTLLQYMFWMAAEIILIVLLYSAIARFALYDTRSFDSILKHSFIFVPTILFIPYLVSYLYFALKEKNIKINNLMTDNKTLNKSILSQNDEVFNFCDTKGHLKLSIMLSNVYYLEAADNYVNIFYHDGHHLSHYMLRGNLKEMEEQLGSKGFQRCHRSYIVNMLKIKMISKEKEGIFINFEEKVLEHIPVSKSYVETIVKNFAN
ncbi:MAG: LytTR family transcriptional regulator [Bacteroidales bacterium]|nr:LytTR family transcriptional regulator [Bacteroidales bacterium]